MPGSTKTALERLFRLTNYERTRPDGPRAFDLARPAELLRRLGSPDRRLGARVIQVAGTKGKGSTCRFLEAILRAAGLRTGLFLSPHVERIEERIAVDGRPIETEALGRRVAAALDAAPEGTTFFEAMLAAACLHFAESGVEAAVLEVGVGGRLDATTAVPVTRTVITTIARDHEELLGDTLEKIAAEKAGILRAGVPLLCGVAPDTDPGRVILETARARGAPFTYVPPPPCEPEGLRGVRWNGALLPALGRHQAHNAALAWAAAGDIDAAARRRGVETARLPACVELFPGAPAVIVDGAHNPSSIRATLDALDDHLPRARPVVVFAVSADKDHDTMIRQLAPRVQGAVCTRADARRGAAPAPLAQHPAWREKAEAVEDPGSALARARALAGPSGLVLVTGSIYLAGALRGKFV
jgi:dihydrofolate synthase/folylpolyglutamate synthase